VNAFWQYDPGSEMEIEWDALKAEANNHKHGVRFDEAAEALLSPLVKVTYDLAHSQVEDRWIAIGLSPRMRLILVVYTRQGSKVRIISARKPTSKEIEKYDETKDQS